MFTQASAANNANSLGRKKASLAFKAGEGVIVKIVDDSDDDFFRVMRMD